jgi:hypothetical protein
MIFTNKTEIIELFFEKKYALKEIILFENITFQLLYNFFNKYCFLML